MHRYFYKSIAITIIALTLTACHRQEAIYEAQNPISNTQHKFTQEQVEKIIVQAAIANGWGVEKIKPGELKVSIKWGNHSAVSSITYSSTGYDISLLSSDNLKQEDGKIHRKYNQRVKTLQDAINKKLGLATL